jgi:uncharacterized protein YlxW (UPF0749 family)
MPETPSPAPVPDRFGTPLLTMITQQSLDEDYRHVAERRASGADPAAGRRLGTASVVVAVFGLLVTVAAVQNSEQADVASASRATLIANIEDRRDDVAALQDRIVRLRELNISLQDRRDEVASEAAATIARTRARAAVTGFEAVTGPGVRVTVDDAPDGSAVRDRDLRPLVDGLWNAGAEAVAVNGQRLTARTAIRNSGAAIRVNNRSLSPPYVVLAIGDPRTLQADLMETTSGLIFRDTADSLGFPWTMDNEDRLSLPAAPARLLRLRATVEGTAEQNRTKHNKETPQ